MRYLLLSLGLLVLTAFPPPSVADEPSSPETIGGWVAQLNDDVFLVRERATSRLIEAGAAAIEPVTQATLGENPEVTARGIHILQRLAFQDDNATCDQALSALQRISQSEFPVAANRASSVLVDLEFQRTEIALRELERLGAIINRSHMQVGNQIVPIVSEIRIAETWKGSAEDLRNLRWLTDTRSLILDCPDVNDACLEYITEMHELRTLKIKGATFTSAGLAQLKGLNELRQLYLFDVPLDDAVVDTLSEMSLLADVKLFGTGISDDAAQRLKDSISPVAVDVRLGGFLGVGGQDSQEGCMLTSISEDSAAERAGLQINDVVTHINGQEVANFAELTAIISQHGPGDTITIASRRDDESFTHEVELGEWDL